MGHHGSILGEVVARHEADIVAAMKRHNVSRDEAREIVRLESAKVAYERLIAPYEDQQPALAALEAIRAFCTKYNYGKGKVIFAGALGSVGYAGTFELYALAGMGYLKHVPCKQNAYSQPAFEITGKVFNG